MRGQIAAVGLLLLVASVVTPSIADPPATEAALRPGYRVVRQWSPPAVACVPVAAVRLDRDRDGDADVAVLYRDGARGLVAWIPVRGSAAGPVDELASLDFAPAALAAADLDGDGREELAVAEAEAAAVRVFAVAEDGRLAARDRFPLPGIASRLETSDRSPRDGWPELVVELAAGSKSGRARRWTIGSADGPLPALATRKWQPAPDGSRQRIARRAGELLATHLDADAHPDAFLALEGGALALAKRAPEAVIVVTSTSETADFGGAQQVGDLPGPDGLVTLREAIIAANNTAGADVVQFNIPSAGNDCHDGACWFTPSDAEAGPLPWITDPAGLTLDGYTQTTNRGDTNANGPELVLDGSGQTGGPGFNIQAPASAVIDFVVVNFDNSGINAADAPGLVVKGCYVGTNVDGTAAAPNNIGIQLLGGTSGALVGGTGNHGTSPLVPDRNLVSGNLAVGVHVGGVGATTNVLRGNRLGTDRTGATSLGNQQVGVRIDAGADDTDVGGSAAGAANLISGNSFAGVLVSGAGSAGIVANTIGADLAGTTALPNGRGISIQDGATDAIVFGPVAKPNLVSGNTGPGIDIVGTGTTSTLINNWIGVDSTGAAALPNAVGVHVAVDSGSNVIGGAAMGSGNVIAGNTGYGVHIDGSHAGLYGNRFGTNAAGTASIPNGQAHIRIDDGGAIIGIASGSGRNLISGTMPVGIDVDGLGANMTTVNSNWFGLDAAGTGVVGSLGEAVRFAAGAWGRVNTGNYFTAADKAVVITDAGTDVDLVQGSVFGRSPTTSGPAFANQVAIRIANGATGTTVGGGGIAANEITNSAGDAIEVVGAATTGNRITRNSIHDNGGLAIDLAGDGVTPNDAGDGDAGPNQLANFPVLASAVNVCGAGTTAISGTVDTTSPQLGTVELFQSSLPDASGFGEATTYLTSVVPAANGSFATSVPAQPVGSVITATFTDAAGNTSELSAAIAVVATPLAPTNLGAGLVAGPGATLSWVDNASDETQFRIERRAAGGSFGFHANASANAVGFGDSGPLSAGVTYYYQVRAENGACVSSWSNVASVLVPGPSTPFCRTRVTSGSGASNPHLAAAGPGVFGIAWREVTNDAATLRYARLDSTGAVVAGPVTLRASSEQMAGQVLASNGGGRWGMAWYERLGDRWTVFFATYDLAGALLTGPIAVSDSGARPVINQMLRPGLAWDGQGWGIVWPDARTGARDVRYVHIANDGFTKETVDVVVSDGGVDAFGPRMAWTGSEHAIVWVDGRTANNEVYLRRVARDGTPAAASAAVTSGAVFGTASVFVDVVWDGGGELGVAWSDLRDSGVGAVFFRRLSVSGVPLSAEQRLSDPVALGVDTFQLSLARTATRWVVAVEDARTGDPGPIEIRLAFADPATGAKLGADVLASSPLDAFLSDHPSLAWSNGTLIVGWHDASSAPNALEIHAQAMDETGNPGANPRRVVTSGHAPGGSAQPAAIEPLGNGSAVAWLDSRAGTNGADVYLRLLDGSGNPTGAEILVPDAPASSTFGNVAMAWSGEVLAIAWRAVANGRPTIAFFDGAGAKLRPDVQAPLAAANTPIDLHWTGESFLVAWEKSGAPDAQELFVASYLADGSPVGGGPHRISQAAGRSQAPSLAGGGGSLAVAWRDTRDGNGEIYVAALDRFGARVGAELNVTNEASDQSRPSLAWSGGQHGLAWADARTGLTQVRFRRLAANLALVGSEVELSSEGGSRPVVAGDGSGWGVAWSGLVGSLGGAALARVDAAGVEVGSERLALHQGLGVGGFPAIAWDGARFVLALPDPVYFSGEVSVKSSACVLDSTPPTCASGLGATVNGRNVTLTWTPGIDADFALERQTVDRNGVRIAAPLPAATSYVDLQLEPGPYAYQVGALNQGYLSASACSPLIVTVTNLIFADGFESGNTSAWSGTAP